MINFTLSAFSLPASLRLFGASLMVLSLCGCTQEADGVDGKLAGFQWPSLWQEAKTAPAAESTAAAPLPSSWWQSFGDPELQSLVETALKQNLDVRAAEARLREARANERATDANLYPTIDATFGAQRRSARTGSNTNTSNLVRGSNVGGSELYQAGFDAGWEIDLFGRLRSRRNAASFLREASESDRDAMQLTIVSEVVRNYVNLRLNQSLKALAEQTATTQTSTERITRARYEQGVEGNLELSRATAALENTRAEIPRYDALSGTAAYSIDLLLAQDNGTARKNLTEAKPVPFITPDIALESPVAVIAQRPDIKAAEANLRASASLQDAAFADLFPTISLSGAFGYAGGTPGQLFKKSTEIWSFGGNVLFPLLDFGRLRAALDAGNAKAEQAFIAYESAVRVTLQEVETAALAYTREVERQARLQKSADANRKAMEIAQRQYKEGILAQLDVLAAQRDFYTTEAQLNQSTANVTTNLVALYKAVGRPVIASRMADDNHHSPQAHPAPAFPPAQPAH